MPPRKNNLWFILWFPAPCLKSSRKLWKALSTPAVNLIRCGYFLLFFFTVKTFYELTDDRWGGERLRFATRYVR